MATLQRALCWETMGKSDQAKEEYAKISRHPTGEVAKKATMMLDGFEASEFFNGEHFDFMTQKGAYKEDMIKISRSWDYQSWNTCVCASLCSTAQCAPRCSVHLE
jgi:hypothetical protein